MNGFNAFEYFDYLFDNQMASLLGRAGKEIYGISCSYPAPQFPPMDVEMDGETKDLYFTAALAGYDPDEVDVRFDGDYMFLSSTLKREEEEKVKKQLLRKGIKKSSFEVRYVVPVSKYDTERANATFENGLLHIKVPAKETMKPKKINIEIK